MKSGWQTVLSAVESYNLVPRVEEDEDGMVQPEKPGWKVKKFDVVRWGSGKTKYNHIYIIYTRCWFQLCLFSPRKLGK